MPQQHIQPRRTIVINPAMTNQIITEAAPNTSYWTPAQVPPAGTPAPFQDGKPLPTLFQPMKIRGVEFHNRLFVAPMGLSSANHNATVTPFHTALVGGILLHGPGLTIVEATAVSPEGRITHHDPGLWSDEQIPPLRALVEFAHSQGQKIGVQLAHGGRKNSLAPLWLAGHGVVTKAHGGWAEDAVAPSALPYVDREANAVITPHALTGEEVREVVRQWADAARRAVEAGVDVIEIHAAHGFLLHQFLSPVSNRRTDEYGGSFDNRARIVVEIVDAIREVIPETMPLFLRPSATDWLEKVAPDEPSWRLEDTVRLARLVAEHGVDLIDVSSGGLDPRQKVEKIAPAYQAHFAEAVKTAHGERVLVGAVGGITTGTLAQEVLDKGQADVILAAKQLLNDPAATRRFAEELGVEVKLPNQLDWSFNGRGSLARWKTE
ncbi:FMN-linked oxidoreductase [Trametes elegans]|nr:FMN-linked oxidoreductase [Trametes elegans]